MTNDPKCNRSGDGDPAPRELHHRFLAWLTRLQEPPAWLVGVLAVGFMLRPVLSCGHAEAYRRLRTLLALVLVGLLLVLMVALAVRLPLAEVLMLM